MASANFPVDNLEVNKGLGNVDLVNDPINVALLASFLPTYSAWASGTSYSEGDIVIPSSRNGRRYRATNAGTSGSSEPTWPTTAGGTVTDNGVNWEEYGGEHADNEFFNDVSGNELAGGDGYTAGGQALSTKSLSKVSTDPAVARWDADDVTWTSLSKTFMTAWIYVDGGTAGSNDYVLAYILLDDTHTSVSINGVDFTLKFSADGILTFGRKATL